MGVQESRIFKTLAPFRGVTSYRDLSHFPLGRFPSITDPEVISVCHVVSMIDYLDCHWNGPVSNSKCFWPSLSAVAGAWYRHSGESQMAVMGVTLIGLAWGSWTRSHQRHGIPKASLAEF